MHAKRLGLQLAVRPLRSHTQLRAGMVSAGR